MEATKKIKAKKEVKEVVVKNYAVDGTDSGTITLKAELLSYEPNKTLLAQYVRVYLANQREGNASSKTRAEVSGTTKKVYKQKGTGLARHGSKRPLFIKGEVSLEDQNRQNTVFNYQKAKTRDSY